MDLFFPHPIPSPTGARGKQVGFIQVYIAKVQTQPAKMAIMLICAISSGEGGFGFNRSQIHFIGEKL